MPLGIVANLKDSDFHSLSLLLEFLIEISWPCICIIYPETVREVSLVIFSYIPENVEVLSPKPLKNGPCETVWLSNALHTSWSAAPVAQTILTLEVCVFREKFSSLIIQGFPNYIHVRATAGTTAALPSMLYWQHIIIHIWFS